MINQAFSHRDLVYAWHQILEMFNRFEMLLGILDAECVEYLSMSDLNCDLSSNVIDHNQFEVTHGCYRII